MAEILLQGPGAAHLGDWRVIDFGIARRYVDEEAGTVLPAREGYGEFRGSTTYASIHAHLKLDLGPCSQCQFWDTSDLCDWDDINRAPACRDLCDWALK
jgi:hypothetical protein